MGFPVPINSWFKSDLKLKSYFIDKINKLKSRNLDYLNITDNFTKDLENNNIGFSRKYWVLLNLELWYEQFIDKYN